MSGYIDIVAKALIHNQGFQLVSAANLRGIQSVQEVMLGRYHWSKWQLVRLIPADQIPIQEIAEMMKEDESKFEDLQFNTRSNGVTGITVLVFAQGLSPDNRNKLQLLQKKALWQNNYSLLWIVDLTESRVWKHQGHPWWIFLSDQVLLDAAAELGERTNGVQSVQQTESVMVGYSDDDEQEEVQTEGTNTTDKQRPIVTYTILVINIFVFLIMSIWGDTRNDEALKYTLVLFGAKFSPLIVQGEYWRLFTSVFIHIGKLHLIFNSVCLYQLGSGAEYIYGYQKYAIIYILAGLSGSIASFVYSPHISAGASGAIFGLFGALLYFGLSTPRVLARGFGSGIIAALVINLTFGLTTPGVDNYAHVGGLIGGYMASSAVGLKEENAWQVTKLTKMVVLLFILAWFFYYGLKKGSMLMGM